MNKANQRSPLYQPWSKYLLVLSLIIPLFTQAQSKPLQVAVKLYPIDLLPNQYNALHGGIELYKRPFSLHVSYGWNAGVRLRDRHEQYQKGYKYKAGVRYYFSTVDTAGSRLPSAFFQVLYSYLDYTQQRHSDHYTDVSGVPWHYESTQLSTRRSGVEALIGKNLVIYRRLMVEASAGMFLGYMNNRYWNQTGVGEYSPPADNFGWLLPENNKYRKEGRTFLVRPAGNLGITYWFW